MLREYFIKLANSRGEFANKLRKKRFEIFMNFINLGKYPNEKIKVLDAGGRVYFWEKMEFSNKNLEVTVLNLETAIFDDSIERCPNIKLVVGNVCNMEMFENNQFDIVFSNSVIEHVGDFCSQKKMAKEVQRVGKSFFIQTPNYWFPFEPHFLTFGFQYLPIKLRALLLRHFNLGWYSKVADYHKSIEVAQEIRLLSERELKVFFPGATIYVEKFFGLDKSFIFYQHLSPSI